MNSHFLQNSKLYASLLVCASFIALTPDTMKAQSGEPTTVTSQQRVTATGIVSDAEGPLIGASVREKNNLSNGAATDFDGKFTLTVPRGATLLISYIGMKEQEVTVTGKPLEIMMEPDADVLEEVVVVGFGTQKKVNLTGSVGVATAKDLKERPVATAAAALQGVIPGLEININNGALDSKPGINVRGGTTIGEGTSGNPLILIDGMEGDINSINPQDIESISVLKDAAASSIYGSRAPFGVILVTTKSGSTDGTTTINYNNSFRFSNPINKRKMMNSIMFMSFVNDLKTTNGEGAYITGDRLQRIVDYANATPCGPGQRVTDDGRIIYNVPTNPNGTLMGGFSQGNDDVDYYDMLYRDWNFSQEHNVSVSGGTRKLNYYASGSYYGNNGLIKLGDEGIKRFTATAKVNSEITKWLRFNVNMRFTREDYHRLEALGWSTYEGLAYKSWPLLPFVDRNGYYVHNDGSSLTNLVDGGDCKSQTDNYYIQTGLRIEPVKNWVTSVDFNYRVKNNNNHTDFQMTYNHDIDGNAYLTGHRKETYVKEYYEKNNYYNFNVRTEYDLSINKMHNFHVMAGFQAEDLKQFLFSAQRSGITVAGKPELDITDGNGLDGKPITPGVSGQRNEWSVAGFFGRLNYDYKGRYLLEANVRADGSSRFRQGRQWKTFPSVSVGWNIAQESFWKDFTPYCNLLKLRASYGSLGNQNTNNWYYTYQTIGVNPSSGGWLQNGVKPTVAWTPSLISALLTWERVETYNIGIDWGLFNNRLTGSFDWFTRNTKDMVGKSPELPNIFGPTPPSTNNTNLQSNGWELGIEWRDRLACGLSYSARFNVADARTKITRYPNNPSNDINATLEGYYTGMIWGYETYGIARTPEQMQAHLDALDRNYEKFHGVAPATPGAGQNALGSKWAAGDIMYKDINGDGIVSGGAGTVGNTGDMKVIGNTTPRYRFGLDLNAQYKGFDLRVFFQGVMKRDFYSPGKYMFGTHGDIWNSAGIMGVDDYYRDENTWSVINGFMDINTDSYLPRLNHTDAWNKNSRAQTTFLQDASYIRLKNLQVGYTLPRELTSRFGVQQLRFYVSGENLWTGTKLRKTFDPETIDFTDGNDYDKNGQGYPLSRTIAFGLSLNF